MEQKQAIYSGKSIFGAYILKSMVSQGNENNKKMEEDNKKLQELYQIIDDYIEQA